ERGSAGAFGNQLRVPREQTNCFIYFFVAYQNKIIQKLPEDSVRQFEWYSRRQPFVLSFHTPMWLQLSIFPGVPDGRRLFGLHTDHAHVLVELPGHDAAAGSATAAADGRDDHVDIGQVLENF